MPIHDLGYRGWESAHDSVNRWMVIAETGIRLTLRNPWVKRMLFLSWVPVVLMGLLFFIYEQAVSDPAWKLPIEQILRRTMGRHEFVSEFANNPGGQRHQVWAYLLFSFFRYPQAVLIVLFVGLVAPRIIAQDVRSRAFLLYFSRPVTRYHYVLGKSVTVWSFLMIITTVPAMLLYVMGVMLSPELSVVSYTWDLPLRILFASLLLILPTTSLALCFSSMTSESRYAAFCWFATWILGWVAYSVMRSVEIAALTGADRTRLRVNELMAESPWSLLSLYHTLGRVQAWAFGLEELQQVLPHLILLAVITVVAQVILAIRVTSPIRV